MEKLYERLKKYALHEECVHLCRSFSTGHILSYSLDEYKIDRMQKIVDDSNVKATTEKHFDGLFYILRIYGTVN